MTEWQETTKEEWDKLYAHYSKNISGFGEYNNFPEQKEIVYAGNDGFMLRVVGEGESKKHYKEAIAPALK